MARLEVEPHPADAEPGNVREDERPGEDRGP
jgi:hypothetical protein